MLEHIHEQSEEAWSMMEQGESRSSSCSNNKRMATRRKSKSTNKEKRNINFYPKCHVSWPSTVFELTEGKMLLKICASGWILKKGLLRNPCTPWRVWRSLVWILKNFLICNSSQLGRGRTGGKHFIYSSLNRWKFTLEEHLRSIQKPTSPSLCFGSL